MSIRAFSVWFLAAIAALPVLVLLTFDSELGLPPAVAGPAFLGAVLWALLFSSLGLHLTNAPQERNPSRLGPVGWILVRTVGVLAALLVVYTLMGESIGVWPLATIILLSFFVTLGKRDEVERRAEMTGLYVGGSIGVLIALASGRFLGALDFWRRMAPEPQIVADLELQTFFIGMFHLTFCIAASAYLVRLGWWIAKR